MFSDDDFCDLIIAFDFKKINSNVFAKLNLILRRILSLKFVFVLETSF